MNIVDLAVLYLIVGAGCSVVVYRRTTGDPRRRAGQAALSFALWPIWVPVALVPDSPPRTRSTEGIERIEHEIAQAEHAASGSPFEALFNAEAAARIKREVHEAATKIAELDAVLGQEGFDLAEADRRIGALTTSGSRRALETAVLHRSNVARLEALRARQLRALEELGELVGALRSQLVLARYAGSSPEGVGGMVSELWARVEGLGEAMDAHIEAESIETRPERGET